MHWNDLFDDSNSCEALSFFLKKRHDHFLRLSNCLEQHFAPQQLDIDETCKGKLAFWVLGAEVGRF